jgi:hypothetical protein
MKKSYFYRLFLYNYTRIASYPKILKQLIEKKKTSHVPPPKLLFQNCLEFFTLHSDIFQIHKLPFTSAFTNFDQQNYYESKPKKNKLLFSAFTIFNTFFFSNQQHRRQSSPAEDITKRSSKNVFCCTRTKTNIFN